MNVTISISARAYFLAGLDDSARYPDLERVDRPNRTKFWLVGPAQAVRDLLNELDDRATEGREGYGHTWLEKAAFRSAAASIRLQLEGK